MITPYDSPFGCLRIDHDEKAGYNMTIHHYGEETFSMPLYTVDLHVMRDRIDELIKETKAKQRAEAKKKRLKKARINY